MFFSSLTPEMKLFWFYLITKVDQTGCWEVNFKIASFFIGKELDEKEVSQTFKNKFVRVGNQWWIPTFVKYHHGDNLSRLSNFHKPVIEFVERHGLVDYLKQINVQIKDTPVEFDEADQDLLTSVRKYWRRMPSPYELKLLNELDRKYLDKALRESTKYNKQSVAYVSAVIEGMKKKEEIEKIKSREEQAKRIKEEERKMFNSAEHREAWLHVFDDLKKQLKIK